MIASVREAALGMVAPILERAGRPYRAGPELHDGIVSCRDLAKRGWPSALAYWNASGEPPRNVADACLDCLDGLAAARLPCYVSVKPAAFSFSRELLAEMGARSRRYGLGLHMDSHGAEEADRSFELIEAAGDLRPGVTLPGRWRRSVGDAEWALERRLRVRVVKGQWPDPSDPGRDPRAGFLAVIDRLAGRASHVAVASHDAALTATALERLVTHGTPCEVELLHGLPRDRVAAIAAAAGVPVRVYVPYGFPWVPYTAGDIRSNPRLLGRLLHDLFR